MMKKTSIPLLVAALLLAPALAAADPHKGGKHGHGAHKQEYWDGNCKVKRKFKKNGDYKEERKCHGEAYGPGPAYAPAYAVPAPVLVPAPGIVIQGTVRLN